MHRLSALSAAVVAVGVFGLNACSSAEPAASERYCSIAVSAANGRINFLDDEQYASIVSDPDLPIAIATT